MITMDQEGERPFWEFYEKEARAVIALLAPHFRNEGREEAALIAERHAVEWPSRYHEDAGQDMAVACTKVAAAIRASKEPT